MTTINTQKEPTETLGLNSNQELVVQGKIVGRSLFQGQRNLNFYLFTIVHIFALVGLLFVSWTWKNLLLCLFTFYLRVFGVTAGYHRYLSHRSFNTGRVFQFILVWIGCMSLQKGPLWWAAHHRHHHKYTDKEEDVHSPTLRGFIWSHCGWFLFTSEYEETQWKYIPDLAKFPELKWLNNYHTIPGILMAVFLFAVGGFEAFFWGWAVSTVILWHVTFMINSLAHVHGSRRYATDDTSRNSWILAILAGGEGWHNNHHTYMSSANQGFFWWEVDFTYTILYLLSFVGLVYNLRKPPLKELEVKLVSKIGDPYLKEIQELREKEIAKIRGG